MATPRASFTNLLQGIRGNRGGNGLFNAADIMPPTQRVTPVSVQDMVATTMRGGPNMSLITDAATGQRLSNVEAAQRMPQGGYKFGIAAPVGFNGGGRGGNGYDRRGPGSTQDWTTGRQGPRTSADYVRQNGGLSAPRPSLLNELYRNQPGQTMGAYDRLQSQQQMDQADPNAGFVADQIGVAQGAGDYDKASFLQNYLQDLLARKIGSAGAGAPATTALQPNQRREGGMILTTNPDGTTNAVPDWGAPPPPNAPAAPVPPAATPMATGGSPTGPATAPAPFNAVDILKMTRDAERDATTAYVPNTDAQGDDILGEGTLYTPYGTAGVTQNATPTTRGPNSTFTNGQGSSLGGVNFPGQQGTFSAADFFQDTANRQGIPNKYAVPAPGYGGTKDTPSAWEAYAAAMKIKNQLKA